MYYHSQYVTFEFSASNQSRFLQLFYSQGKAFARTLCQFRLQTVYNSHCNLHRLQVYDIRHRTNPDTAHPAVSQRLLSCAHIVAVCAQAAAKCGHRRVASRRVSRSQSTGQDSSASRNERASGLQRRPARPLPRSGHRRLVRQPHRGAIADAAVSCSQWRVDDAQ